MAQNTQYTPLIGGLDLVTPPITIPPGRAIGGINYEPHPAGYQRVAGIERYDGRPKPSAASYSVLNFDAGTAEITEGQTVTGATSGATGVALLDAVVETGSYGGSDAAGYLVITAVSGSFLDDENLQVSAVTKAVADGEAAVRGASNDTDDTTWIQDAIETARGLIGAVSGSGAIRGIHLYNTNVYAFRDNPGGTAGTMWKASTSGWTSVDLGREISFDAGTAAFAEGETLTGGTSGATATIKRVIVESGDWTTSDADGYLILSAVAGAFEDDETVTSASGSATADGVDAAITLGAGGIYRFRNHNFYGASNLERMYGAYGEGRGFEFDGTVFVPIRTGMVTDEPTHLMIQNNHLFFGFPGGSAQHAAPGDPYAWSPILGAAELGMGDEITVMLESTAGPATIFTRFKRILLYGNDVDDWQIVILGDDAGAIEDTGQKIGRVVFMDDLGVRTLSPTDAFGDFRMGTVSQMVEPLFRAKRKAGTVPTASIRVRSKDQYRLFFSDMSGITIYFGRKTPEILPFNLGITVRYASSCECAVSSSEHLFIGSDDGFVYQLDSGTSFDGEAVGAFLRLPFNHIGSPTQNKRWHKATLEVDAAANTQIGMIAEFAYADPEQPPSQQLDFSVKGGGGFWDEAQYDEFYWSSPINGTAEAHIDGLGRNISIGIVSNETYQEPHIVHGITLHFSYRNLVR